MRSPVTLFRRKPVAASACLLIIAPLAFVGTGWIHRVQGADTATSRGVSANRAHDYALAVAAMTRDHSEALDRLERLRKADPRNALPFYLEAAVRARQEDWAHACEALKAGNAAPELLIYTAPTGGADPSELPLAALRGLAEDCVAAAPRLPDADLANGENLLWECAVMARRMQQDARPHRLAVLESAARMRVTVENGRMAVFQKQGRFEDADSARLRMQEGEHLLAATKRERAHLNASVSPSLALDGAAADRALAAR